jgi:hypothetical protein
MTDRGARWLIVASLVTLATACGTTHGEGDADAAAESADTGVVRRDAGGRDTGVTRLDAHEPIDAGAVEADVGLPDASLDAPEASPTDADLRSREDATGFCRPDGTCVCFEEGWGVCPGRETICTNLGTDADCGRCGRNCWDTSSVCRHYGGGCSCESGMCRQGELVEWWQAFGVFSPGFLQYFHASADDDRGPGTTSFAALTISPTVDALYIDDGVAYAGRRSGGLTFTPVVTEDRIREAYVLPHGGYMISEDGHVYFTDSDLGTVWRSEDVGDVQHVCIMHDENFMVLLGDGRVLATGAGPDWLGTGGVAPPARGFLEVVYPRPVVSLACHGRTSIAILDDGSAWFAGERVLPASTSRYPLALVPEPADLTITRRFERVFSVEGLGSRMFCVASTEIGGLYACWYGFDPISFVWRDLPRLPFEVREGDSGICGRFDLGGGSQEIRCIEDTVDARATRRLVWSNVAIGALP